MESKFYFFVFIFLFFSANVFAVDVEVSINESSTLVELLSSQYSLSAQGVLSVYNPSNVSRIYEFTLPLNLDSLIGISKRDRYSSSDVVVLKNTTTYYGCSNCTDGNGSFFNCSTCSNCDVGFTNCSNCTNSTMNFGSGFNCSNCSVNVTFFNVTQTVQNSQSEKFTFSFDKISGFMIDPNETVEVNYDIYGILNYNIYDKMNSSTQPVLDYYIDSYNFMSNVILNLDKPDREGSTYFLNGSLNSTPGVGVNTTRVVSAVVRNPTDYDYFFNSLKLFKTTVADPFFDDGDLVKVISNFSIEPFSYRGVDFIDKLASENNVYWLSSDVSIGYNTTFDVTRNFKLQQAPTKNSDSVKAGGGGGRGIGGGSFDSLNNDKVNSILIKKDVDKTMIRSGEEFTVFLRIANVNDFDLHNLEVFDEIPDNYQIKNISGNVKVSGNDIKFMVDEVQAYDTVVLSYSLVLKDEFKGITYLKPAKLIYNDDDFFSQGVLLINDLLPNDKIFVQKEVQFVDEDFAKVIITVKNLGNYILDDVLISDGISEDSIVKQISQMFYDKGIWRIKSLDPGEEWQVSYLIRRDGETFDSLPNVFGVDKSDVFGTLVSSGEVVTVFNEEPGTVEKLGLGISVGFLVIYLLF